MPYFKQYKEEIGGGPFGIDVIYNISDYSETGTFPTGTAETPGGNVTATLYGTPSVSFRQQWKLPTEFESDPYNNTKFNVTGYSNPVDRILYVGDDLSLPLNNNYGGCCFDENGDPIEEPKLDQKRVMDITLEALGFDAYGKPTWASQNANYYFYDSFGNKVIEPVGPVVRSETFTVTLDEFLPNILETSPHIDDDITVEFLRSDGLSVICSRDNLVNISMSATYPETIKIKIRGNYTKYLFPYDTWEYYFEKIDPETREPQVYTPVPGHLKIEVDTEYFRTFDEVQEDGSLAIEDPDGTVTQLSDTITNTDYLNNLEVSTLSSELPYDPNDFIDAYRIDQNNKNGTGTNGIVLDLSTEIPAEADGILQYQQDPTNDKDITYTFTTTSSIPALTVRSWALGIGVAVGDYISNGGNIYHVDVGGIVNIGPEPPADTGPSGTGFFVDNSGITYRYIPNNIANYSEFGAGTWQTTQFIMNNYLIGAEKYQEIVEQLQTQRRTKFE